MTTQPLTARPVVPAEPLPLTAPVATTLPARTLVRALLTAACLLIPLSVVTQLAKLSLPDFFARDLLASLFDLGGEANLPSAFSAVILWIACALLWAIGQARRAQADRFARVWLGLSAVFGYLGLDEFAQLHDRTVPILRHLMGG